uniref:Uncharacterized protein n=1 Tax=Roseihalotalea indica TaxID=2867963 RepID=A0AA49GJJ7_9BACT|nr:hypothetical protein K4G66_22835 [Tunicatimonas sp. TK19036]
MCLSCVEDQSLEFNPVLNIPPTCSDGIKNQDETAVDCGGACSSYCGSTILASCTDDLQENFFHSREEQVAFNLDHTTVTKWRYDPVTKIVAEISSSSEYVEIELPVGELPVGNVKFNIARNVSIDEDYPKASLMIFSNRYFEKKAVSGKLYLRLDGDKVHLEFCDILIEVQSFYGSRSFSYEGNINFPKSEFDF